MLMSIALSILSIDYVLKIWCDILMELMGFLRTLPCGIRICADAELSEDFSQELSIEFSQDFFKEFSTESFEYFSKGLFDKLSEGLSQGFSKELSEASKELSKILL